MFIAEFTQEPVRTVPDRTDTRLCHPDREACRDRCVHANAVLLALRCDESRGALLPLQPLHTVAAMEKVSDREFVHFAERVELAQILPKIAGRLERKWHTGHYASSGSSRSRGPLLSLVRYLNRQITAVRR